jgi:hypothetical protein
MEATTFATCPGAEPRASGNEPMDAGVATTEPWTPRAFGPARTTVLATAEDMLRFAALHVDDVALPPCVESMRKSTYTRGSMRGASDGRGLRI